MGLLVRIVMSNLPKVTRVFLPMPMGSRRQYMMSPPQGQKIQILLLSVASIRPVIALPELLSIVLGEVAARSQRQNEWQVVFPGFEPGCLTPVTVSSFGRCRFRDIA